MVQKRSETVKEIQYLRTAKSLPGPASEAIVSIGLRHRLRTTLDAFLWLRSANTLREIFLTEFLFATSSVIVGMSAFVLSGSEAPTELGIVGKVLAILALFIGLISIAVPGLVPFLLGLIVLVLISFSADLASSSEYFGAGYWNVTAAYALIFGVAAAFRFLTGLLWGRFRDRTGHKDDKRSGSHTLSLSFKHADKVTDRFKTVLTDCFSASDVEKISSITTDVSAPYRLVRGILPVSLFFLRRPRSYQNQRITRSTRNYRKYRLIVDTTDAICAGLLGVVGARPRLRYGEESDDPLAKDRYWRSDGQEINDTGSSDVFLRFHQSTVEADFPPKNAAGDVCNYKAYAVMNNFRGAPLYLLRVRDVVDVLYCRHKDYSEKQQQKIYDGLNIEDGDEAVSMLQISRYAKITARADRYQHETVEKLGKSVLAFTDEEKTDAIMSFDPGRVWPMKEAPIEMFDALIALRRAVHVASRKSTIEITPERRDVLLVDNLRMMICRREDAPNSFFQPFSLVRDTFAGTFEPLAGRWLRQIYGFPEKTPSQQCGKSGGND